MKKYGFNSKIELLNKFDANSSQIKNEPMFFNCDLDFAYVNGGEITRNFINALPIEWLNSESVIDTRCHMLMPGWYPAIPGYHHDDVPRAIDIPSGKHFGMAGQPNYDNPHYNSEHILALVNADIAPTQFAIGDIVLPKIENGVVYREWDKIVRGEIANDKLKVIEAPDRQLVYFDCHTLHTAVPAVKDGWRWFARVSRNTDRAKKITNEIRKQVQVYLEYPMQGW